MKLYIQRLIGFVYDNWSSIFLVGSLGGLIFALLYPPLAQHEGVAMLVVLNALAAILIEIRQKIGHWSQRGGKGLKVYSTMREARPEILDGMFRVIRSAEDGEVLIRGGRIRSIIELFRELEDKLRSIKSQGKTTIRISIMNPDFLGKLVLPGEMSEKDQLARNASLAGQVNGLVGELKGMVSSDPFVSNGVSLDIAFYESSPFAYYFVLDKNELFFGGYRWNYKASDFDGPGSPCWKLQSSDEGFSEMRAWLASWNTYDIDHAN